MIPRGIVGPVSTLSKADVSYLDAELLDERGFLRVREARDLQAIEWSHLRLWAHKHAIYQFPTAELIAWLREHIGERPAIEIGAGHGAIARALGIRATDSYGQLSGIARAFYEASSQPPVEPATDVIKLDALDAVERYRPHTVIGAWITHLWREGDEVGSMFGVDEGRLLRKSRSYVLIGNESVHNAKPIMSRPHETFSFPWLVSRSQAPELNRIWVWKGNRW